MGITFNTNLSALTSQRYLGIAGDKTASSLAKLSSGSRVPTAKDDAAALAVGSKLRAEVAGLTSASNNASQAVSLLQIADGALSTIGDILVRQKALAVQSSSGQLSDTERSLLNQEFTNLRSEIDRIANVTNFNGTSLLAGSTDVTTVRNNLVSFNGTTNDSNFSSLVNSQNGFEDISFSESFGNGAVKISYDNTGTQVGNLTVTDLVNNISQTITVTAGAISTGQTESYNFGDVGVTITLNDQFNKTADLASSNTARVTAAGSGSVQTQYTATASGEAGALVFDTANTPTGAYITTIAFTDTAAGPYATSRLFGEDLVGANLTVANASTKTAAYFDDLTVTVDGVAHVFQNTNTQDVSSTGNKDFTFDDGQGNTFTLRLDVGTAATADADVQAVAVAITAGTTGGRIENSGSVLGSTVPKITAVTEAATAGSEFDFGSADNARLTIDASTATSATLSIVLNGQTFTNTNTTGGGTTANLSTTGIKTVTLANTNVAGTANTITVQFNVTQGFTNGDVAEIGLGDVGQVVGATSYTSGNTSFSFKVGTGVTSNDSIAFSLSSATTAQLGISASVISTAANADTAITALSAAITTVSSQRADIGANQSRLDFAAASIAVAIENTTAAQSGLLDVDVSSEITEFTSQQVLLQAGVSLLAQANQQPSLLLRLLQ